MITAVIQIGRQTAAIELPQDRFSLQYWLAQMGIRERPENIPISNGMDFRNADPCSPDFIRKIKQMAVAVHLIDDDTIRLKRISDQAAGKEETEWNR